MNKMITRRLDLAIEDKFLLNTDYVSLTDDWEQGSRTILKDITYQLTRNTGGGDYIGRSIRQKYLKLLFRHLGPPGMTIVDLQMGDPFTIINNLVYPKHPIRVSIVRGNRELIDNMTQQEIRDTLKLKFRQPGMISKDYYLDPALRAKSGFHTLYDKTFRPKYRDFSTSSMSDVTDHHLLNVVNCPQFVYKTITVSGKGFAGKTKLDNLGKPIKWKYYFYAQFSNNRINQTYDSIERPKQFDVRLCWVYEDA